MDQYTSVERATGYVYGKLDSTTIEIPRALASPQGKYMVGVGSIPEADHDNPVVYQLLFDQAWDAKPLPLDEFVYS